jgi:hypothetical protein
VVIDDHTGARARLPGARDRPGIGDVPPGAAPPATPRATAPGRSGRRSTRLPSAWTTAGATPTAPTRCSGHLRRPRSSSAPWSSSRRPELGPSCTSANMVGARPVDRVSSASSAWRCQHARRHCYLVRADLDDFFFSWSRSSTRGRDGGRTRNRQFRVSLGHGTPSLLVCDRHSPRC